VANLKKQSQFQIESQNPGARNAGIHLIAISQNKANSQRDLNVNHYSISCYEDFAPFAAARKQSQSNLISTPAPKGKAWRRLQMSIGRMKRNLLDWADRFVL
jgi:hypothetical protein